MSELHANTDKNGTPLAELPETHRDTWRSQDSTGTRQRSQVGYLLPATGYLLRGHSHG